MNGRWMKMCSVLLVLCMVINLLPMSSFAAALTEQETTTVPDSVEPAQTEPEPHAEEIPEKRTQYTKEFRMSNGLYMAVVYPEAVHFETENGWEEIDNTLVAKSGAYTNTAGAWDVSFPQQMLKNSKITITKDGYTLSFNLAGQLQSTGLSTASAQGTGKNESLALSGISPSVAVPQQIDLSAQRSSAEIEEAVPVNLQSRLQYGDVFQDTDIIYDLDSNKVKESIVIEKYSSTLQGYRYDLNTDGMIPVLEDSGQVLFYDEKQENVVMVMPAPYLIDANSAYNEDIQVTLTGSGNSYTLTYLLPQLWLASADRAWPVVLDPVVTPQISTSNIKDRTVAERDVYSASSGTLECGYSTEDGIERIYLQYVGLPELTGSEVVVEARLGMWKVLDSAVEVPVEVHKVKTQWDSNTITWANKPDYNSLVEDYVMVKNQDAYYWNVTNIVRGWYENENTGMMFKLPDADEQSGTNNWKQFRSSDYSDYENTKPTLFISYRHNNGIETHYSYQTMSAGLAGSAYVADATGQLKVSTQVAMYSSQINPFSMNLVYNSDYFAQNPNANDPIQSTHGIDMYFGRGFTLDIIQTVEPADLDNSVYDYLVYHDGDGTNHYFEKQDDGTYLDEDGLGLSITVSGSNYTMTDDQGNTWTFTGGILTEQTDEYGNKIRIGWQKSGAGYWFYNIYQQNVGQSEIPLVTVTYVSGTSYVNTIKDAAGRIYRFVYDDDYRLIGIYQRDSQDDETETHLAKYDYSGRRLIGMRDMVTGYQLWYEYSGGKISSLQEQSHSDENTGACMDVSYTAEQTIYHDYGVDCIKGNADDLWTYYSFDYYGHTVNICTKDATGKVLGASTAEVSGSGSDTGNLRTNNRTMQTASTGTIAQNLLGNGHFETNISGWVSSGAATTATLTQSGSVAHTGGYSLKGWVDNNHSGSLGTYVTKELKAGTTYTFSAFVNTSQVTSFAQGGIRLIVLNSKNDYWQTTYLNHSTQGVNNNWEQISITFTPTEEVSYNLMIQAVGVKGTFYVDDVQLEIGSAPSNYNLLPGGDMATTSDWDTQGSVGYANDGNNRVLSLTGKPTVETCAWKNVRLMQPGTQTYLLSGWAWADSVPDNDDPSKNENYANDNVKRFGLQAIVVYDDEDETREYHYASFCPDIHSWQYTSLTIVPEKPDETVKYIQVVCAYEKNANVAWFDDISLVMEPAQTMHYDDEGNLTSVTTTGLEEQRATYENGNLIQSYTGGSGTYNYEYNETHEHQLDSVNDKAVEQTYEYDEQGNVVSTTIQKHKDPGDMTPDSEKKTMSTSAVYSDNGNLILSVTDASGNTVNYSYSAGISTILGLPTTVTDAKGTTTTTNYDAFGRTTNSTLENLAEIVYTYSSDGVLTRIRRNNSQDYHFTYDIWDRTTQIAVGDRTLASYEYAPNNGNLLSQTYGNGDKVSYTYDLLGRVKTVTYTSAAGVVTRVLTNTYNGNGQLYSIHDSATGQTLRCVYDNLGRLISVDSDDVRESYTYNSFNQLTEYRFVSPILGDGTQTYTYDADSENSRSDGMLINMTTVSGHTITYGYDGLQRLTQREINSGRTGGGMWDCYTYKDGSDTATTSQIRAKENWLNSSVRTNAFFFEYDGNGNITKETWHSYVIPSISTETQNTSNRTTTVANYTYDDLGQLTGVTYNDGRTESYTYDNAGNILTFNNGNGIDLELFYDDPQWKDLLTKVGDNTITYDTIGNPLTYYNGYTFNWAEGRRLQSVTTGENQTTSYLYDADGLRVRKTNPDGTYIQYHLMNGRYLGETHYNAQNQPQKHIRYTYDEGGSIIGIGIKNSDASVWTEYYFEKNLQGDVIAIYTAANGANGLPQLVASYTYDSWGNILSATGELAELNPFRYRSYYYDAETNFYYLRSRYYNPQIGRFLNADNRTAGVGGEVLGYNMFAYCFNNPVNMTDETGSWPTWSDIGAVFKQAISWVDNNIIQPVVGFVEDVAEDVNNYDPSNQSEEAVLESNYFSSYKGVPVIRTNGERSGSFGMIFLTRETNYRIDAEDVVRHEYGHTKQLEQLGVVNYALCIGLPSWQQWGTGEYYSKPWEITADIYGGVQTRTHSQDNIDRGSAYLKGSKMIGPFVWMFIE